MPFHVTVGDIVKFKCDAIVNAANNSLLGGGGVDGAIHRAAGPELLEECRKLNGCKTGEAKITNAYNLPSKYVIHTVGPVWNGGNFNEESLLRNCYRNSLALASEYGCKTVAFPVISSGAYGYPFGDARKTATDEIVNFLCETDSDMDVYLIVHDKSSVITDNYHSNLEDYIRCTLKLQNHFVGSALNECRADAEASLSRKDESVCFSKEKRRKARIPESDTFTEDEFDFSIENVKNCICEAPEFVIDESFNESLFRLIDEKGITDSECYKNANIDRKLFSKIRCSRDYKPSKETVISLALGLKLNLEEANSFMSKAGYALSDCYLFDVIIKYCIENKIYKVVEVNDILFDNDQKTLS